MSEILYPAPLRALDANGVPVGAAQAFFYRTGTTTPLTVYSDEAGTVPHPSPLVADANGIFAPVFNTSAFAAKVDIQDPTSSASLPGYPVNISVASSTATGAASGISFSPTDNVPETNTQAAIVEVDTNARARDVLQQEELDALGTASLEDFTDNDDLSISPGNVGTRGNVAAAIAVSAASGTWTYTSSVATTSGTAFDFGSLPAGITDIELILNGVNTSGTDSLLIQIGTGSTPVTTGYANSGSGTIGNSAWISSTSGWPMFTNASNRDVTGILRAVRLDGGNIWTSTHLGSSVNASLGPAGGGSLSLGGALGVLRLTRTGSNTFNAGTVYLRYK